MVGDFCKLAFLTNPKEEIARDEKVFLAIEKDCKNVLDNQYACAKEHLNWDKEHLDVTANIRKLKHSLGFITCKYEKNATQFDNSVRDLSVLRLQVPQKQDELVHKAQELDQLKDKEEEIKQKYNEGKDKMKNIYTTLILAKDVYKKHLNCHLSSVTTGVSINSSVIYFTFGSKVSSEESKEFSGTAQLSESNFQSWKLLAVHPPLQHFEECVKNLEGSDDVRGLLCYLNQEFKNGNRKKQIH